MNPELFDSKAERRAYPAPRIPVAWGELIDKLTILEIKAAKLSDERALANVRRELVLLRPDADAVLSNAPELSLLKVRLRTVNESLWAIEDDIREKEARSEFDGVFIELARSVYKTNDERAAIKREINRLLASELIEEKSYKAY